MGEESKTVADDVFAIAGDASVTLHKWHTEMWENMRRSQLLHAKPEKLNAPVYETISREMIHDSYNLIPLDTFLADLTKLTNKAPKDSPVFVSYDKESDYEGGYYYYFEVGFERPPTPEEIEERKKRNAEIREVQTEAKIAAEKREREEFERLRTKFEG